MTLLNDLTVSAFIIISYLSRSCLLSIFLFLNAIWYSSMHDFKLDLDPGDGTKMSTCLLSWFLIYPDVGRFLVLLVGMSQLVWMNSLFRSKEIFSYLTTFSNRSVA